MTTIDANAPQFQRARHQSFFDVALLLVQNKVWKWRPGAATLSDQHGRTWRAVRKRGGAEYEVDVVQECGARIRAICDRRFLLPDLSDAPTVATLEVLLREARGHRVTIRGGGQWSVETIDGPLLDRAHTYTRLSCDNYPTALAMALLGRPWNER